MNQAARIDVHAAWRTRVDVFVGRNPTAILTGFVILWTIYETLAHAAGNVSNDMAEAYAWGQELQLGYFKHPPFWAWVTFAWFKVVPIGDWSAYLFSALNAAVGIFFVSRCAAFFLDDGRLQWCAALLLIFIPAYTFHGMKINANTIHLSIWPAATWVFLSLMVQPSATKAVSLGFLASCALLSKYNALLFLVSILVAAISHPAARTFWRSPMPMFVALGAMPLVILHGLWLWQNDFLPFHYFQGLRTLPLNQALVDGQKFIIAEALYAAPAMIVLLFAASPSLVGRKRLAIAGLDLVLVILATGPALLSATACSTLQTRCPALWGLQNLYLMPLLAIRYIDIADPGQLYRRISTIVLLFLCLAVLSSPMIAWIKLRSGYPTIIDPNSEVATKLTQWWRDTYLTPLRIVGGDAGYALAISFYSPDHPSYFISADRRLTPWVSDERLALQGALFICNKIDKVCEIGAANASADRSEKKEISPVRQYLGQLGQENDFSFFVIPPASWSLAAKER